MTERYHHVTREISMGVFRYENRYAAPTKEQRERYMAGTSEERHFGPDGEIMLIEYREAAYLKDDIDGVRILFTGFRDRQKARQEAERRAGLHQRKQPQKNVAAAGKKAGEEPKPGESKPG
ncbi:MAG: hypothetical protein ABSB80_07660 [Methanoregula sp.]|jgi:hypothetical protein|uniref:hypothetical protein n=1 Tax=Methanoregula sp. TaxID=2052170 RepID=UPI003D09FDA4